MKKINDTLKERDNSHGHFADTASIAQSIKWVFRNEQKWRTLNHIQMESLDLIATKCARILSGDPDLTEHWYDINGYSELARQDAESRSKK